MFKKHYNLNGTTKIYCRCIITGNLYECNVPTRDLENKNLIKLGISPEGWKWWKKKCKL
jgi:hypothetical protein